MILAREQARKAGKVTYSGAPCSRCRGVERYVQSSACVACQRARRTGKIPRVVRQENGRKGFAAMRQAIAEAAERTPPPPENPVKGNKWPGSFPLFEDQSGAEGVGTPVWIRSPSLFGGGAA